MKKVEQKGISSVSDSRGIKMRPIMSEQTMEKDQQERSQVSVGMDVELREQLEAAAKRAVRSLSGEINWRLRRSLESEAA